MNPWELTEDDYDVIEHGGMYRKAPRALAYLVAAAQRLKMVKWLKTIDLLDMPKHDWDSLCASVDVIPCDCDACIKRQEEKL
jgi:hypothetical protein